MMTLHVARLHPDAHLPTRGSDQAAGLDLYSVDPDTLILPGRSQAFATSSYGTIDKDCFENIQNFGF